ncbi:hypothetical protein ABID13_004564 [Enterocloster citroniae]|uniref:Uncharacterized protein n=1 Tax=Enterocloster citroniae TaxID=358743 RepID=A0ABV2G470_9FIRM
MTANAFVNDRLKTAEAVINEHMPIAAAYYIAAAV